MFFVLLDYNQKKAIMNTLHSYKDLLVWQKSMEVVVEVYKIAKKYPKDEIFGLTSQTKRSAVSIPSNIAEGRYRGTRKDYTHFIQIAYASGAELETQIEISKRIFINKTLDYKKVDSLLLEVMKMLNVLLTKLKAK